MSPSNGPRPNPGRIAASALVDGLAASGVEVAFGLDDPRGLFAELRRSDAVRPFIVHDERAGGYMADAYARLTGRPVVCSGISAAGAINLAPALLEAWRSSVPLIPVIGEFRPPEPYLHAFQEGPHLSLLGEGLVKDRVLVERAEDAFAGGLRAGRLSLTGRPRPVLLLAPDSLLWEEEAPARGSADDRRRLADVGPPAAPVERVAQARAALAAAKRPVIYAGGGVNIAGAHDELSKLAMRYRIPVVTSMSGKGAIAETDPLALGVSSAYTSGEGGRGALALRCLREADVVLVVGSDMDALATVDWTWPGPDATLVRIDIDPSEFLGLPAINLWGDAKRVLAQLVAEAPQATPEREQWLTELSAAVRSASDDVREADLARDDDGTVWPGAALQVVGDDLRAGDIVIGDASYSSSWVLDRLVVDRPGRRVLAPRGSGMLGWGLPAGMGAALACPGQRVTVVTGDGALQYSLCEMETAARAGLALTVVLLNNGVYGSQRLSNLLAQEADYQDLHFGAGTDYVSLARSMGWEAVKVGSREDFADAHRVARDRGGPWLIDVAVHPDSRPPLSKFDGAVPELQV
ncbi:MAG: thiamine pyrophosphate-binding protein [Thermoleophilaceae bacterium]